MFVGYRFPPEIIVLAVRWYLRYGLSYRDVEEFLLGRRLEISLRIADVNRIREPHASSVERRTSRRGDDRHHGSRLRWCRPLTSPRTFADGFLVVIIA